MTNPSPPAAPPTAAKASPTPPHAKSKKPKLVAPTHPLVIEKDKSIHSEHGVIRYPFYFGGLASCVSVLCTQPLGVPSTADPRSQPIRVRNDPHLRPRVACRWCSRAVERRKHLSTPRISTLTFCKLTASLTRTVIYSGIRFGVYEKLKELSSTPTHSPTALHLAALAAFSGASGSLSSNFADVVCLRIQNDPGLAPENRRNYRNIAHGTITMIRTEGWSSIWTGAGIGAGRAAVATATQLAGYDVLKRELLKRTSLTDDVPAHITASCLAGFLSTFLCSPLDVFKARIMTGTGTAGSSVSRMTMLKQIFKNEGPVWMFRGLTPALISRGPSTVITFVTFEQLKKAYRKANNLEE